MNWILEKVKQISDWCSWSFLSIQGVFWVLCDVDCGAVKFESRQMVAVKWPNFIAAAFVLASRKKKTSWDLPVPYQISCSVSILFLMKTIGVFGCLATSLITSLWLLNFSDKGYRYPWFYGWRSFSSHTIFVQRTSCSAKWKTLVWGHLLPLTSCDTAIWSAWMTRKLEGICYVLCGDGSHLTGTCKMNLFLMKALLFVT